MTSQSSDSSDKGHDRNRANYWLQHVAKIINKCSRKPGPDDIQQIKYGASKLHQIVQQMEKPGKDGLIKHPATVDTLITILQVVPCDQTMSTVISIFIDLVGKIQTGKRALALVNQGLTTILFQMLKLSNTAEASFPDDLLIAIHLLLSRIGHKDRKFAVKARLHQSLMITLGLVKSHLHNFRNLQPLLHVLKLYTSNSVNASYLGKHNSISLMFKVISACGKRHTVDLKLALENLNNITKSKSNSARLIGMGGVPTLLTLHSDWQQLDTKHRYLIMRKVILQILKNITNLKCGRKSFAESDGIRVLYESALEASDCRDMEGLILLASVILRKCCPRNKLPVPSVFSPMMFSLPQSPNHVPECYFLPGFPREFLCGRTSQGADLAIAGDGSGSFHSSLGNLSQFLKTITDYVPTDIWPENAANDESDHSSMDDDDDIDSDDERFRNDQEEPDDEQWEGLEPAEKRTYESLCMYEQFFQELFDTEFPCGSAPELFVSSSSNCLAAPGQTNSDTKFMYIDTNVASACPKVKMDFATTSRYYQPPSWSEPHLSTQIAGMDEKPVASAINLKTGASVISLDVGCRQPFSQPSLKPSKILSKIKPKKRSVTSRDKRGVRKPVPFRSVESLTDTLSSINVPSSQEMDDSDQATMSSNESLDEEFCEFVHDDRLYSQMAADTHSIYRFQKIAYPDLFGVKAFKTLETLLPRKCGVQRTKIFEDIDRMIHPDVLLENVVYDLDAIIAKAGDSYCAQNANLANRDELRIGNLDASCPALQFNSQFECGNLRKAVQVREFEYDLILNPDINSNHHHQWFYFEVSNMLQDITYRFNLVNLEKANSQFNFGMQPLMMSVAEAFKGNAAWSRVGSDICYYKNHFIRHPNTAGGVKGKSYFTATFTVKFQHTGDVCYMSYHYPYTYTALKTHISQWERQFDPNVIHFSNQTLCTTLGGNSVPLLTITAQPKNADRESIEEFRSRPYIFLTGRVHPGESNASWVMKGTIDFLMSKKPQAQQVREMFIFKIVPMLNPDGVLNGNHRTSLVGEDLNRRWAKPCSILHAPIYHTKGLLLYLNMVNKTPLVYCDYHGHSRRKNIFMYGCSPNQSWIVNDTQNPVAATGKSSDASVKALPRLLHASCSSFCMQNCSYVVERVKETTARVVVWRHIGVIRSYTMESSYCGCDQGKYKDMHINTGILEEMGHKFCETLIKLAKMKGGYDQQRPVFDNDSSLAGTSSDDFFGMMDIPDSTENKDCDLNLDGILSQSDSDDEEDLEAEEEEFDDT